MMSVGIGVAVACDSQYDEATVPVTGDGSVVLNPDGSTMLNPDGSDALNPPSN